jgi:hypothetical protein
MPLQRRATRKIKGFDISLSLKANEDRERFIDARNVYSSQDKLQTRHGMSRFNDTSLGGACLSLSYFQDTDEVNYILSKVGEDVFKVAETGASTSLKSGLVVGSKHRGLTLNNKHLMAIETDGLFQYNGTDFTQLGQSGPIAPTLATNAGALTDSSYKVALTYYSSTTGFETNAGGESATVATVSQGLLVSAIPITADNATIDKIRVYLKDITNDSDYLFVEEINLGVTSTVISADPGSSATPPTVNGLPPTSAKYMTVFNKKLVVAGLNDFKNDVLFSEPDLPDAFDSTETRLVLNAVGDGPITGVATGFFNDSIMEPYLVVFKSKSIHIYSERDNFARFIPISDKVGCVSHDSIVVKNGNVFFLSRSGWRAILNAKLATDSQGDVVTLGNGDIDDIFKSQDYVYGVNRQELGSCFGIYYGALDQYLCWVPEGSNSALTKTYNYEFDVGGFKPYEFAIPATDAVVGELLGEEVVFFSDANGFIYKHSINEDRTDVDSSGAAQDVAAFAILNWFNGTDDFDAKYNYRELILRAIASNDTLTVKGFINYDVSDFNDYEYTFPGSLTGFILDVSKLDEGVFNDERQVITSRADINQVGENLSIGFYQETTNGNMNLVSAQLDFSKNGNRN